MVSDEHVDKRPKDEHIVDQKPELPYKSLVVAHVPSAFSTFQSVPNPPAAPVPSPVYNWHPFYNDLNLDLVLKSSDDVYLRASKHVLKRCSATFNPDRTVTPANPIVLLYPSDIISLFLSQIRQPNPPQPAHTSFEAAHQYLAFVKRYAPYHNILSVHAEAAYKATNVRWPFDYLVHIANTTGNMAEARWALEHMDEKENEQWDIIEKPAELVEQMERLPTRWRQAVWRLLMRVERDWKSGESTITLVWPSKRFARKFDI